MPSTNEQRFFVVAWGVSLAVHGAAVWLALAFAAQLKPVLQDEVFKWDVALVDAVETDSMPEQVEPVVKPTQQRPRVTPPSPVESVPESVLHRVAPQQTVQMVQPVIEPVKSIDEKVEASPTPKPEPVRPVEQNAEVAQTKVEPIPESKELEPVQLADSMVAQSQSLAVAPSAEPVTQPSHQEAATSALPISPSHDSSAPNNPPATTEATVEVAKAAAPVSQEKADHRWLAESLWRRVAELKRYPSSARLNGQEGKVILKAVIRSDGHLAEVSVQKSSGHAILDTAAMEAVKLACPLNMKFAISKPEIVVSLPIVYSLVN
jgi:protein TonB